tara:strand:- start:855 stop:1082 length:228 start_codon:yes stop_codon:yes gene_type:complete
MSNFLHLIQQARILQFFGFLFVGYITYDFHVMYVEGFSQWVAWQHTAAGVYVGGFLGAMKIMYSHISAPIERDHE